MERSEHNGKPAAPSLLGEIFAVTNGNGQTDAVQQTKALQQLHTRLASPEFAAQMTGIFFEAKREALAGSK